MNNRLSGNPFLVLRAFLFLILIIAANRSFGQWEFAGSPERLEFVSFAWDGNKTYVATWGGIYYTNDDGATWHPIPDNSSFIRVRSLEIHEGKMYVMADTYRRYDQLFVSADGGTSWEEIKMLQLYGTGVSTYAVRGDTVIIAMHPFFLISFDGGLTVADELHMHATGNFAKIHWVGNTLIGMSPDMGAGSFHWRSTDLGKTWTKATSPDDIEFQLIGEKFWRHAITPGDEHIFSVSQDEGITWDTQFIIPETVEYYKVDWFGDEQRIIISHRELFHDKIYTSTDDGESWSVIEAELDSSFHLAWLDDRLYGYTRPLRISSSIDLGKTWHFSNSGIREARVETIVLPEENVIWLGTDVSRDGGLTWQAKPDSIYSFASSGNGHMIGQKGKNIFQSHDAGLTWTYVKTLSFPSETNVANTYYLGGKYIISYNSGHSTVSHDGGNTWSPVQFAGGDLRKVGYNDGKYYANRGLKILISDDFVEWEEVTYDLYDFHANSEVRGMMFQDQTLLLFNFDLFRLDLDSMAWKPSPYVSNEPYLFYYHYPGVEQIIAFGDVLIAAVNGLGVFISHNTGLSWEPFNDGLGNLRAYSLTYDDQFLYVGMLSGGIWRRPLADLGHYTIIKGNAFFDQNQNSIRDTLEILLPRITITSAASDAFVQTRHDGTFSLFTNVAGQDTIEAIAPHPYSHVTTSPIVVNGSTDSLFFGVFFEDIHDLKLDITNLTAPRPGFDLCVQLTVTNTIGLPTDVSLILFPDLAVTYVGADSIPAFISADSIVWDFKNLAPGKSIMVKVVFHVPSHIDVNVLLQFAGHVLPEVGDVIPEDNYAKADFITVGAIDPNDKAVFPAGNITPQMVSDTLTLTYTIRFQNLGTYQADIVRIVDTLSESLDIHSLQILSASHEFTWRVRQGRVLEFLFDPIFLPHAAADELGSHGFVKYSINADPILRAGDKITNQAHIYFDYNQPVATNRIESFVKEITVSADDPKWNNMEKCQLSISPNPASQEIEINIHQEIELPVQLQIIDNAGRLITSEVVDKYDGIKLDIRSLPIGMFSVIVSGKDRRCVGKFVKTRF